MYDKMVDNPELFVGSVSEGVQRALREPYAFFLERVMADYSASRHCQLMVNNALPSATLLLFLVI
jgi:hypothetical protein